MQSPIKNLMTRAIWRRMAGVVTVSVAAIGSSGCYFLADLTYAAYGGRGGYGGPGDFEGEFAALRAEPETVASEPASARAFPGDDGGPTYGFGLSGMFDATQTGNVTISPLAGYRLTYFDGGRDHVFTGGVRATVPLDAADPLGLALGGEVFVRHVRCTMDAGVCMTTATANGVGLSGVVAKPIGDGAFSLWAAAGPTYMSDFKANDFSVFENGLGFQAQVGASIGVGGR